MTAYAGFPLSKDKVLDTELKIIKRYTPGLNQSAKYSKINGEAKEDCCSHVREVSKTVWFNLPQENFNPHCGLQRETR